MTVQEAKERVNNHFLLKYHKTLDDLEISNVAGYWRDKEAQVHKGHPLHSCLGCNAPFKATYSYFDSPRENGKFASTTRTWKIIKEAINENKKLALLMK